MTKKQDDQPENIIPPTGTEQDGDQGRDDGSGDGRELAIPPTGQEDDSDAGPSDKTDPDGENVIPHVKS
jgi:hypothetical protein